MARYVRPIALVVVAFVAGALLNPFSSDATARGSASEVTPEPFWVPTSSTTAPRSVADEDRRTEEGAVAAAAAFVCTGQQLIDMTDDEVDAFLRDLVSGSVADRVVAEHLHDLAALRDALGSGDGPIVYREGVVSYRVEAFDSDDARISIWHVGVLARDGVAPAQAGWMLSTVDLVWERGGWKVVEQLAVPGPAPILNDGAPPATAGELIDVLDGFTDFRSAA